MEILYKKNLDPICGCFLGTFRLGVCVSSKKLRELSLWKTSVQRFKNKASFHTLKTLVATEKGKNKSKKRRNAWLTLYHLTTNIFHQVIIQNRNIYLFFWDHETNNSRTDLITNVLFSCLETKRFWENLRVEVCLQPHSLHNAHFTKGFVIWLWGRGRRIEVRVASNTKTVGAHSCGHTQWDRLKALKSLKE